MEQSLDDYIRENPGIVKNMRHKMRPTPERFGPRKGPLPSQQWRLGRNGPRPLKRLARNGPLRPFPRMGGHPDRMPRLVQKRFARLPPHRPSPLLRLGWNPVFVLAKQRVRQARQHFWRRQQFYPSRVPSSFPMGRRPYFPMYRPNNGRRQFWQFGPRFGPRKFQKPAYSPRVFFPNNQNSGNLNCDQLIKNERLRVQEENLRNVQTTYRQQGQYFNQQRNQPTLPDDSSAAQYPIARDGYASNVPRERAPSPEGSIISAMASKQDRGNPFAEPNPFAQPNPFGQPNTFAKPQGFIGNRQGQQTHHTNSSAGHNSMGTNQGLSNTFDQPGCSRGPGQGQQMRGDNTFAHHSSMETGRGQEPHPFLGNFRPNLHTGSIPLNERYTRRDDYSAPMNSSMMA